MVYEEDIEGECLVRNGGKIVKEFVKWREGFVKKMCQDFGVVELLEDLKDEEEKVLDFEKLRNGWVS